jgi:phage baseplate assembly protein W
MALNTSTNLYGINNPRSPNQLVKRQNNKLFGFKYPIGDLNKGGFLKKSSDVDAVKGQLRQLLLTNRGERVMLPSYGTNLRRYLMEPLDQATLSQIKREILESFSRYAPNVGVTKIQVFPGGSTQQGGNFLIVKLFCVLLTQNNLSFDITLDIV